ncbi:MAG: hypothetical protein AB7J73_00050 [Gammaproteobacteria bacterium]
MRAAPPPATPVASPRHLAVGAVVALVGVVLLGAVVDGRERAEGALFDGFGITFAALAGALAVLAAVAGQRWAPSTLRYIAVYCAACAGAVLVASGLLGEGALLGELVALGLMTVGSTMLIARRLCASTDEGAKGPRALFWGAYAGNFVARDDDWSVARPMLGWEYLAPFGCAVLTTTTMLVFAVVVHCVGALHWDSTVLWPARVATVLILGFLVLATVSALVAMILVRRRSLPLRGRLVLMTIFIGTIAACSTYGLALLAQASRDPGAGELLLAGLLPVLPAVVVFITSRRDLLRTIKEALRSRRFWQDTASILQQFPQPGTPQGYVFVTTQTCVYTIASVLLVLCRLRQLGWATIVIDRWPIEVERTNDDVVDQFFGLPLGQGLTLQYEWDIDWQNGVCAAQGLNFFHPIWEGLGRHFGRYHVDIRDPAVSKVFKSILKSADSALQIAFRIYAQVAGQGRPVRLVGSSAQFAPNAVYVIFCREIGYKRDMHFVWLQQGYQTYYADKEMVSKCISLENMTRLWPHSNPYLAHREAFERWMSKGQDVAAIMREAQGWVGMNRATDRPTAAAARAVQERIEAHRARGGAVACLLGKIIFDLSIPWEHGPAHADMKDWLNHSVDAVRGADDVLLLVKPHPHELRSDIAGRVDEYFTDMLNVELPSNVIILGHRWFNLHQILPLIDIGVMWNGTSVLELGVQGKACVMCSDWGPYDYPVGVIAPRDRDDYARMLRDPKSVTLPDGYAERCAMLLKYTASDEVMIPYEYSARPLTNAPFGPPFWRMERVERFIADGDPSLDFAATKFL